MGLRASGSFERRLRRPLKDPASFYGYMSALEELEFLPLEGAAAPANVKRKLESFVGLLNLTLCGKVCRLKLKSSWVIELCAARVIDAL